MRAHTIFRETELSYISGNGTFYSKNKKIQDRTFRAQKIKRT